MTKSKNKFVRPIYSKAPLVSDHLRGWIERVIVPILVKEFVRAKGLQKEDNDG